MRANYRFEYVMYFWVKQQPEKKSGWTRMFIDSIKKNLDWNIFYPHREIKAVKLLQYAFGESPTKSDQWWNVYSGQISDEKQMCDNNMLHKGMMNKQKWA